MRLNRLDTLRISLRFYLQFEPTSIEKIEGLYDIYLSLGGNGFIHHEVEEWRKNVRR